MPTTSQPELISLETLNSGHALSERDQPILRDLFAKVRTTEKIALVIGAGISVDSGLPSWPDLLSRMVAQVPTSGPHADLHAGIRAALEVEGTDQLRRAENLQTVLLSLTTSDTAGLIRTALWQSDDEVSPGELARSLARLIATNPCRFRILTTNFDNLLEQALEEVGERFESVSLETVLERVQGSTPAVNEKEVVHLHGLVTKNDSPPGFGPVVLTESEFLRYGEEVKMSLRAAWRECKAVVFLGVSMSDPNLIGPLWDISNGDEANDVIDRSIPKYIVSVVENPAKGMDIPFSVAAAIARYRALYYLKLHGQSVLLKSYGQLIQLVHEMGLAAELPARYVRSPRSGRSIRYGTRFQRGLTHAYARLGCTGNSEFPRSLNARVDFSNKLQEILTGNRGFVEKLHDALGREGLAPNYSEHFGLYLWLRQRSPSSTRRAPYSIVQVGASSYVHRDEWSRREADAISFESHLTTGLSLFKGAMILRNLTAPPNYAENPAHEWRATLARPLIVMGFETGDSVTGTDQGILDRLTIGAISLTTNFRIEAVPGEVNVPISGLARVKQVASVQELAQLLNDSVSKYLFDPRP